MGLCCGKGAWVPASIPKDRDGAKGLDHRPHVGMGETPSVTRAQRSCANCVVNISEGRQDGELDVGSLAAPCTRCRAGLYRNGTQ